MKHRILIVGAGTGGTLTANLLARELTKQIHKGTVEITLLGDSDYHVFQPGNLNVAFHGAAPETFTHAEPPLVHGLVRFLAEGAGHIRTDERVAVTKLGRELPYDHLVLATGAVPRPDLIPGLAESAYSFHEGPQSAESLWHALQRMEQGRLAVVIADVPYKCPPSPNEAIFLADEQFRARGIRDDVELWLLTPYPHAYPAAAISQQVQTRLDDRGIHLEPFFNLEAVNPERRVLISMEGEEVPYDLLVAIPPHRGAQVIMDSGLGDDEGFIDTDHETMRVAGHKNTYALGDGTNIPISKSGVVAHLQSLVVARNILADLGLGDGHWLYNGRINCPMEVGDHKLLFVSATYQDAPQSDKPTHTKYAMKQVFNRMYWSVLSGSWEWMFKAYFGKTSKPTTVRDDKPEQQLKAK